MFKVIIYWIICWSLLATIYYWQRNNTAVFTLLCVAYIPVFALFIVYLDGLVIAYKKRKITSKTVNINDFVINILLVLIFSFLLILSFSLPEITQDARAIKLMLIYVIASITAAFALISFIDAFIKKT